MSKSNSLLCATTLVAAVACAFGEVSVIPQPAEMMVLDGCCSAEAVVREVAKPSLGAEAYELEVAPDGITAYASDRAGFFYARQTLAQLKLGRKVIPCLKISDAPRFRVRALGLDVSRHFFTVAEVKRFIDLMSKFKFNHLKWHLVDDHGWRMQVPKYPLLTEKSAWRYDGNMDPNGKPYGGFYTTEELEDIVRYASERCVTIIPDIDIPGHASEMTFAYPFLACDEEAARSAETLRAFSEYPVRHYKRHQSVWPTVFRGNGRKTAPGVCCVGKESTFAFYRDIYDEVMRVFPSKMVIIDGDEVPTRHWEKCEKCQARLKEIGGRTARELLPYAVGRVAKYLADHGRQAICDDDVLEGGVPDGVIVNSWRGMRGGIEAVRRGLPCMMGPEAFTYFNQGQSEYYYQPDSYPGILTVGMVYSWDPVPELVRRMGREKLVLGIHFGHWSEAINDAWQLELQCYPRALAGAEVAWTAQTNRDWEDFQLRLEVGKRYLESLGVDYYDESKDYHGWDLYANDPLPGKAVRPDTPREAFIKKARQYYPRLSWRDYRESLVDEFAGRPGAAAELTGRDLGGWNGLQRGKVFRGGTDAVKTRIDADAVSMGAALRMLADPANYPVRIEGGKGADLLAFALQGIAGARETDLAIDYELTAFESQPVVRHRGDGFIKPLVDEVIASPGLELVNRFASWAKSRFGVTEAECAAIRRLFGPTGFSPQSTSLEL